MVDVVHVLRANRLRPLDEWFQGPPTMDFIYYLASLISAAARGFNIKDLGWYNFGVVPNAPGGPLVQFIDGADWTPWGSQKPHWPNRSRASSFWSTVRQYYPEQQQALMLEFRV